MVRSGSKATKTPKTLRLVLADSNNSVVRSQNYESIARESAYIRLQGGVRRQTTIDNSQSLELVLHGLTDLRAVKTALRWAIYDHDEVIAHYVEYNKPKTTVAQTLFRLLHLYQVAEKLVMRNLQREILDVFVSEASYEVLGQSENFPADFLVSRRVPTYGMLGLYLQELTEEKYVKTVSSGDSLNALMAIVDVQQLLESDPQIAVTKAKLRHRQNLKEMAKTWQIHPVDDVPHRFTVFPKDVVRRGKQALEDEEQEEEEEDFYDAEGCYNTDESIETIDINFDGDGEGKWRSPPRRASL